MSAISQKMLTATFPLKLLLSTRCLLISICGHLILQVSSGSYIYMTFDDGPNEGTPYVLDALKEVQIHPEAFCELLHLATLSLMKITTFVLLWVSWESKSHSSPRLA